MSDDLDPDRRLALAYAPAGVRPALEALWRLDVTFGAILAAGREPMVSRLRLAGGARRSKRSTGKRRRPSHCSRRWPGTFCRLG